MKNGKRIRTAQLRKLPLSTISVALGLALGVPSLVFGADDAQKLDAVTVTGAQDPSGFGAEMATLGPLGSKRLADIPYSVSVISEDVIRNQQASSLTDLLKYLPSTQMEARGGMDVGRPQSRGFQSDVVSNNHLDGMKVVGTTAYPMEMMERLEVINGLTGALYGPANPGGTFNYVQKRPTDQPLRNFTLGYSGKDTISVHADLGGRFGPSGAIGYRFNLLNDEGDGFVKGSHLHRKLASAALDFHVSRDTVVEFNASHYAFDKYGYPGSFSYGTAAQLPDAPDASRPGYGQPFAGMELETNTISAILKHRFNDKWNLTAGVSRQIADRYLATTTNALGNSSNAYQTSVTSNVAGRFIVDSNILSLNGKLRSGTVEHDLLLSATSYEWEIFSARNASRTLLSGAAGSLSNPQVYAPTAEPLKSGPRYFSGSDRSHAFTVGDTITFNPQWSAMLLGSYAKLSGRSYDRNGVRGTDYDKNGMSGTASLTYKPVENLSTYIAYADTLQPGTVVATGNGYLNEGEVLSPYRSKQYELGAKYAMGKLNFGAALFRMERPFAFAGLDNVFRVQGNQRNNGLELTLHGDLNAQWSLFGGVTFLDAKLLDTPLAATADKRMVGVPKVQASILAEYKVPQLSGLTLTGNVRHTGSRAINTQNTAFVDGFNIVDLGARYVTKMMGKQTTWRLAVNNVTNERYWVSIFPGNINGTNAAGSAFIGDPREVRASVTFSF